MDNPLTSNNELKEKPKLKKVITLPNIQKQKTVKIPFTYSFLDAFGRPQNRGVWFVWGASGSGKSTFLMQLAKELAKTYKVLYNLLEEEPDDADYIERTELVGMHEVSKNFFTASYTPKELDIYLSQRNSPKVIIIDSLPYFMSKKDEYKAFKKKWATKKIIIFSGHAKGQNPKTDFQEDVMFDAKMKIFVSGYLATCKGRTIGKNGGNYIIYEEGYNKLNGTKSI